MLHLFLVLAVTEAFVVEPWAGNKRCNDPKYWCQNKDTAEECGVVQYCQMTGYIKFGNDQVKAEVIVPASIKSNLQVPDAAPVKVSLYYESLCPGCRQFIHTQLYPTFQKLSSSGILEVELVPYGNAQEYQSGNKWTFYCQHGPTECTGNIIESCAMHYVVNSTAYMPFIYCLEYYGPSLTNAKYCASQHGLDYNQIYSCVYGNEGNAFEHQFIFKHAPTSGLKDTEMALKTLALNPPHQYVPWITVNGVHTDQIQSAVQENMLYYVCQTYQGTKPAACNQAEKRKSSLCYKN